MGSTKSRAEYMRDKKREQRAEAAKAGFCTNCCTEKARKGMRTCQKCSDYRAEHWRKTATKAKKKRKAA